MNIISRRFYNLKLTFYRFLLYEERQVFIENIPANSENMNEFVGYVEDEDGDMRPSAIRRVSTHIYRTPRSFIVSWMPKRLRYRVTDHILDHAHTQSYEKLENFEFVNSVPAGKQCVVVRHQTVF